MKHRLLLHSCLFIVILLVNKTSFSQSYYGTSLGSYGGLKALEINPANVVGSPFSFLMDWGSSSITINNNFIQTSIPGLIRDIVADIVVDRVAGERTNPYGFANKFKTEYTGSSSAQTLASLGAVNKTYYGHLNASASTPIFNFMFSIGRHQGFAFTTSSRSFTQINDFNFNTSAYQAQQDINNLLSSGLDITLNNANGTITPTLNNDFKTSINLNQVSLITNHFAQLGLTYGRNIMENKEHTMKVGFAYKYLLGLFSGGIKSNNLGLNFSGAGDKVNIKGAGSVESYFALPGNTINSEGQLIRESLGTNSGFGIDMGMMYEWNPNYVRPVDTGKISYDRYANPYKLKIGFSIVDLGKVSYQSVSPKIDFSALNYSLSKDSLNKQEINKETNKTRNETISKTVKPYGLTADTTSTKNIGISLPTLMNIYADYYIGKKFYVSGLFALNISGIFGTYSTPIHSRLVIAPRFQGSFLEVSVPISFVPNGLQFKYGLGIRVGGFFIGSDDMHSFFGNSYGMNVYAGVRLGFLKSHSKLKKYWSERATGLSSGVIPVSTPATPILPETKRKITQEQKDKINESQKSFQNNQNESKISPLKILN